MSDEPLVVTAVTGLPEVSPGDDLATLVSARAELHDGDIVVVTSKVVSKAEGRVLTIPKDEAVTRETDREVARRGNTRVVRNRLGLTMAGAGVDQSNTHLGTVVLLPADPDASARALREAWEANVAVVVTDTVGRAWRNGQTDLAIGAAGIEVAHDFAGRVDAHGNELAVTLPAVADEIASAADLVKGKLSHCPVAIVRGLGHLVLPRGQHGPGAASLIRDEATDMFGYGAREAVMHALLADEHRGFGAPAPAEVVADALTRLGVRARLLDGVVESSPHPLVAAAAWAHGWRVTSESHEHVRIEPR
jgi:coenzyme F420-0:L-glutamate ligase / coenzyme F420-1:gamma-L-glutamate ligase